MDSIARELGDSNLGKILHMGSTDASGCCTELRLLESLGTIGSIGEPTGRLLGSC